MNPYQERLWKLREERGEKAKAAVYAGTVVFPIAEGPTIVRVPMPRPEELGKWIEPHDHVTPRELQAAKWWARWGITR